MNKWSAKHFHRLSAVNFSIESQFQSILAFPTGQFQHWNFNFNFELEYISSKLFDLRNLKVWSKAKISSLFNGIKKKFFSYLCIMHDGNLALCKIQNISTRTDWNLEYFFYFANSFYIFLNIFPKFHLLLCTINHFYHTSLMFKGLIAAITSKRI